MIQLLNIKDKAIAKQVLDLQLISYPIEAKLINFYDIPPLKDTLEQLMDCSESFYGNYINNILAGILSFKIVDHILDIHRVCVHPDYLRRGIGEKLITYIEAQNPSINKIIVSTGKANIPAIKLYEKKGFIMVRDIEIAENFYITELEKTL
ncbi:MAG: acetyltransferase, family [Anaerocolumna sp.]|jgi:ribosomal protein S18 acetylase RimI-like enzyme|nr:acetyltransferase, family [Anaerocolumna sp.]